MKQKTNRLHFSTRTLAMVLSIVMLIGSIATGSMLSTFAAYLKEAAANSDAVSQAASEGSDIAKSAIPSQDADANAANITDNNDAKDAPDLSGFEENDIVRGMKEDLAAVGANADLAETGDTTYYLWLAKNGSGNWSGGYTCQGAMTASDSNYTTSFTISTNANFDFCISTSNSDMWSGIVNFANTSNITVSSEFNDPHFQPLNNNNTNYDYHFVHTNIPKISSDTTVYVTFNPTTPTVSISTSASGSGGGSGDTSYDTYTLAGTKIFGTDWTPSLTANEMDTVDGTVYTKSYTNVQSTDNFEFKVVKGHDWGTAYPSSNFSVKRDTSATGARSISSSGSYLYWKSGDTITFTFNSSTKAITVSSETPETTHDVTFSAGTGGSISPSGTSAVGVTTATTVTAAEKPGYDFSGWTIGSGITVVTGTASGASPSKTLTVTTKESGDYSVTALFTAKPTYPITVMTNSVSLGTATSSVAYGYEGQTITLTATEDAGTFGTWSVVSGSVTVSGNTKNATFTMPPSAVSIRANFNLYTGTNTSKYYYDGWKNDNSDNCAVSSGSSYNNVRMLEGMYNGQKYSYIHFTSARDSHSSANKFSITKKESGTRYVYFNDHGSWSDGEYWRQGYGGKPTAVFLDINGLQVASSDMDWVSGDGDAVDKIWKCAIPADERVWQVYITNNHDTNWRRTAYTNIDHGLYERSSWNETYQCYSVDWNNGWGSDYTDAGGIQRFYWGSPGGTDQTYENDRTTARFGSDIVLSYADIGSYTNNTSMVSPKDTPPTDYYVIVYYPNTNYGTINGEAANNTNSYPIVVASTTLPMTPDPNAAVTVYAKDGTLRSSSYETFAKYADTKIYDEGENPVGINHTEYGDDYTYETYGAVKGETITIETIISDTTATGYGTSKFNELYYVKGFCVNGQVPDGTINNSGISAGTAVTGGTKYTLTYTIPEDFEGDKLEVTPIYYSADPNVTTVTFYVDDFPANQYNWGNTVFVYPFYGRLSGANNAMGAYPGQPMVYYGGQYYIQVPTKSYSPFTYDTSDDGRLDGADSAAKAANRKTVSVSGMTLHNGYYDLLHREIWDLDQYSKGDQKNEQKQTYDYDDFYKIYNEKGSDNIYFQYKYKTANDNKSDLSSFGTSGKTPANFTSTFENGFEDLVDYSGKKVNLFGTVLTNAKLQNNPIYVVSDAGGNQSSTGNIAGRFATQWHIFVPSSKDGENPTYSKFTASSKSAIPPSILLLNDEDSFSTSTYPTAVDGINITDWEGYYKALKKDYSDYPVLITYEEAKNDGTDDPATRNDGRWLFSATGEPITSNIRIDISQDAGKHYYPNGDENLVEVPGTAGSTGGYTVPDVSAYFTNTGVNGQMTYNTTIDSDKTFDFTALSNNASYKFVGWYFDNGKKISGSASASTLRNNSYTFVARFVYVTTGTLLLSHVNGKGTVDGTDYQGKGNVSISVSVTDEDGNTRFSETKSGESISIPDTYIGNDKNYDINVTLTATAANNNALGTTVLTKLRGEDATFFNYGTATTSVDGKTRTYTFSFNVIDDLYDGNTEKTKELIYTSYFTPYTFNYNINYEYYDRFDTVENGTHTGAKKIYNRRGTLTADEAEAYVYKKTAIYDNVEATHRRLRSEFVASLAPVVSNFGEDITWDFSNEPDFGGEESGANYVYSVNVHYVAVNNKDLKRNVTFVLPYEHVDGIATLTGGVGTEATATNYALIKESEQTDNRVNFGEIPVLTGGRSNGIYTEEEKAHWIAAPATIKDATDSSKIKIFNYWSIASTSAPTVEVARCYYAGFNFVAYDNYIITAVYDDEPIDISAEEAQTYITYLETTRNQWNTDGETTVNPKDRALAADVLFNDFVLNYSYKSQDLYLQNDGEGDIRSLGVVVQRMDTLDASSDGSFNTDLSNYIEDPTTDETNAIKAMINDPSGHKITGTTVQQLNKKSLDNKNRIEIFEAIYNAAGWNKDNQKFTTNYAYKKYLYRAFSYMIDASGNIILSEKPAYFIMYDVATATNAQ